MIYVESRKTKQARARLARASRDGKVPAEIRARYAALTAADRLRAASGDPKIARLALGILVEEFGRAA